MTPPAAVVSARHLPTPVHRCTAAEKSPRSCGVGEGEIAQRPALAAAGRRRAGPGRTMTPGFSRSSGSNTGFIAANASRAAGEYMSGSSSPRARPSPCSPDIEPPCDATSFAASIEECAEHGTGRPSEREVDAGVHAAVAEVPVRQRRRTACAAISASKSRR